MKTICIFGDSIAWGAYDPDGGGWATRLRNYFEGQNVRADLDVDVYNLGISGDNTEDLAKRYKIEFDSREPDTVLFAIGLNDSQFVIPDNAHRVSIETFEANMRDMVLYAQKNQAKVYIVGLTRVNESKTTPIPWNTNKIYRNESIIKYEKVLKKVSDDLKTVFIDVAPILTDEYLHDGLHPNASGHEKLYQIIKSKLI